MNGRHISNIWSWSILAILAIGWQLHADDRPARPIPEGRMTRERFLQMIDRPRVPLAPKEELATTDQGIAERRFEFSSEAGERVYGLLMKMDKTTDRSPVVFCLHGTGGNKEALRPLLKKLASRGLVAVAIDARFSGERSGKGKRGEAYRDAIFATWKSGQGYPYLYDTVWDILRLVDYLQSRPDIDPSRIAGIGFSKGGTELYLAAAADPRIAAAVPCIGVQSFGWALDHNAWQSRVGTIQSAVDAAAHESGIAMIEAPFVRRFYDRVVPGIHREFDGPAMLPLIAPRPLLVINGDRDDRTPLPGLELCVDAAKKAYAAQNASDRFEFLLQPDTGHAVTPQSESHAFEWLVKHLQQP